MKKNIAGQVIDAEVISASTGQSFTSPVTVYVKSDGGTQLAGGGSVSHKGNGVHEYLPTQAETNADHISFTFIAAGAIPVTVQVYTTADVNVITVGGQPVTIDDLNLYVDYWNPLQGKVLRLTRGDSYLQIINSEVIIQDNSFLDLTGLEQSGGELTIKDLNTNQIIIEDYQSVSVDAGTKTIVFELTSTQTSQDDWLIHDNYKYRIAVRWAMDRVVTLLRGTCIIADSLD